MVDACYYIRLIDVNDDAVIVYCGSYLVADAANGCIHKHWLVDIGRYGEYDHCGHNYPCKTKEKVSSQP